MSDFRVLSQKNARRATLSLNRRPTTNRDNSKVIRRGRALLRAISRMKGVCPSWLAKQTYNVVVHGALTFRYILKHFTLVGEPLLGLKTCRIFRCLLTLFRLRFGMWIG